MPKKLRTRRRITTTSNEPFQRIHQNPGIQSEARTLIKIGPRILMTSPQKTTSDSILGGNLDFTKVREFNESVIEQTSYYPFVRFVLPKPFINRYKTDIERKCAECGQKSVLLNGFEHIKKCESCGECYKNTCLFCVINQRNSRICPSCRDSKKCECCNQEIPKLPEHHRTNEENNWHECEKCDKTAICDDCFDSERKYCSPCSLRATCTNCAAYRGVLYQLILHQSKLNQPLNYDEIEHSVLGFRECEVCSERLCEECQPKCPECEILFDY